MYNPNAKYFTSSKATRAALDKLIAAYDLEPRYITRKEQIFSGNVMLVSKSRKYLFIMFFTEDDTVIKNVTETIYAATRKKRMFSLMPVLKNILGRR